jgi:hypothetical protein
MTKVAQESTTVGEIVEETMQLAGEIAATYPHWHKDKWGIVIPPRNVRQYSQYISKRRKLKRLTAARRNKLLTGDSHFPPDNCTYQLPTSLPQQIGQAQILFHITTTTATVARRATATTVQVHRIPATTTTQIQENPNQKADSTPRWKDHRRTAIR